MRTLKVMMAYCGTRYHGYQRQNNANTVQAVVEAAVSKLLNTPYMRSSSVSRSPQKIPFPAGILCGD